MQKKYQLKTLRPQAEAEPRKLNNRPEILPQ